ncbi:uncharacterized protein [Littorina saxatilis]|uniref:uncharacterized protein n=1 Tax=Littorina saxatilis TaxID=31220 RepID=UPI0038B4CB6B
MKVHVALVFLAVLRSCASEIDDESESTHRLKKRDTSRQYEPIPYISRDRYAQADNGALAADAAANSNNDQAASRDYQGGYPSYAGQGQSFEDWVASAGMGGRSSYSAQAGRSSQTDSDPGSSPTNGGGNGGRPYYQYQPPISTSSRTRSSQTASRSGSSQPVSDSVRSNPGQTYSYPFSGGREGFEAAVAGGPGTSAGSLSSSYSSSSSASASQGQGNGGSVAGDEEPVVQVFPSERPVVNPQTSRQQHMVLLRQRQQERERILEERRLRQQQQEQEQQQQQQQRQQQQRQQQQRQQQQRQQQGGYVSGGQEPTAGQRATGQQRPIYTGSTNLGNPYGSGQQTFSTGGQQPPPRQRPAYGGQQVRYGGRLQPTYGGQVQPVSGNNQQTPYYTYGYNHAGVDNAGYEDECPNTGIRIQINGIACEQAVEHYGSYLCYRHEYTSRECCLKCRGLKNPARVGCEYGDHSGRCQQLQSYDCYDLRNRQSCCQSCERMQKPGARAGCEWGDMTPNCERVRQNPGLCYIPENRYLCCETCSNIRVTEDPECPWGDQNADLCQPFDQSGNIRINCYAPSIKRICCQACERLKEWIPINEPGCEYGDRPVTFNTGTHRNLNCTSFMRYFGYEQCSQNQAVAVNCCYTCHRYTTG